MLTRYFALGFGIVYTLVGLMGFVPAFLGTLNNADLAVDALSGRLLGLFPVNILHSLTHLAIGVAGIAAYRSFAGARAYSRAIAVAYALLAVMGLIPGLNTVFGLIPLFSHDVWLHALTAAVAAYFGFVAPAEAKTATTLPRARR